jgi:hypothetical protein
MTRLSFLSATALIIQSSVKTTDANSKTKIDQGSTTPCANPAKMTTSIKLAAMALSSK